MLSIAGSIGVRHDKGEVRGGGGTIVHVVREALDLILIVRRVPYLESVDGLWL